jgi:hypothetical protein
MIMPCRPWTLIALAVVVVVATAASRPCRAAERGVVALVGEDFADLKWDPSQYPHPEEPFLRWEIYRGLSWDDMTRITAGPNDQSTDFYRDTGLAPDTKYFYTFRIVRLRNCPQPPCPPEEQSYATFQTAEGDCPLVGPSI